MLQSICNRRKFVKTGVMVAAGLIFPVFHRSGFAATVRKQDERRLRFSNTHTGETLAACYRRDGEVDRAALDEINYFFRDFRTGDVKEIDLRLLDLLFSISEKMTGNVTIHLISGYRTPETNQTLRGSTSGVARKSLHMDGFAADIRIPGLKTASLRKIAMDLGGGGVGYYPKSDFVHVDIGRVRHWQG